MANKKKLNKRLMDYFTTGLKVLILNLITGALTFFLNLIMVVIGIAGLGALGSATPLRMIFAIVFIAATLFGIIALNGFVARKFFKWK